jgi:hypothetical protein
MVCFQDCVRPAKTLSYMINSRHAAVISDVELSILKVSLLERVQLHEPAPPTVGTVATTQSPRLFDQPITVPVSFSSPSAVPSRERKGAHQSAAVKSSANRVAIWRIVMNTFQSVECLSPLIVVTCAVTLLQWKTMAPRQWNG